MSRVKREQKALTKKRIIEAARTYFNQLGYEKTNTRLIAETVGIAEGTVYNYFETKADIFLEVMAEDYLEQEPRLHPLYHEEKGVVETVFAFLMDHLQAFLTIPKDLLRTLAGVIVKRPELIDKFAQLDYKLLSLLETLIVDFTTKGWLAIDETKPMTVAEVIYSIVIAEFILFIYEEGRDEATMYNHIQEKITFALKGSIIDKKGAM